MLTKFFSGAAACLMLLNSCSRIDEADHVLLTGTWLESIDGIDTIYLAASKNSEGDFYLARGFEIRNGYRLPKWGSGPYTYVIEPDSIKLISGLSSCACWNSYYFKIGSSGNSFIIGNFYDEHGTGSGQLTFIKK